MSRSTERYLEMAEREAILRNKKRREAEEAKDREKDDKRKKDDEKNYPEGD